MKPLHAPLLLLAFIMGANHAAGQTLTAKVVEAAAGEQTTMTVSLSQPSETTALQFLHRRRPQDNGQVAVVKTLFESKSKNYDE